MQTSYVQTTEQLGWAKTERINFAVCARSSLRGLADVGRAQPTPFRGRPARPLGARELHASAAASLFLGPGM